MPATKTKTRVILLAAAGVLLLAVLGGLAVTYTVKSLSYDRTVSEYLTPYGEKATAYLTENEAFAEAHGDVSLHVDSYTYSYLDPQKYTRLSLMPELPATAEAFEAELSYLTVFFDLPDLRTVGVCFERNPEGSVEIVGWEYTDE